MLIILPHECYFFRPNYKHKIKIVSAIPPLINFHTNRIIASWLPWQFVKICFSEARIMDELDHEKVIKKIIFKELEPSVLNEDIISRAIYDQGPDGEAGKLFRKMEIQYDKISVLRLEFLSELSGNLRWKF